MVIISFILTIFLNDSTVFLLGEIRCWSLLEFKGLDAILARPFISNGGRISGNFGVLKLRDRSLDSSFHQQAVVILNLYNILKTNQFPGGGLLWSIFSGYVPLPFKNICPVSCILWPVTDPGYLSHFWPYGNNFLASNLLLF